MSVNDAATESQGPSLQPLVYLTAPLPGAERLPRSVQRLIAETERDFNEKRFQAALDLSHVVTAQAPDFIPNYLRIAQIRIALGDLEGAGDLVATVERLHELDGIEDDPVLRSIRVAMNPDDTQALVEYARYLVSQQQHISDTDPFLPAAIEATEDSDPATARELARALVDRRPKDDTVVRTYLRSVIAAATVEEVHQALSEQVRPESTVVDLLWWRTASAMSLQEPDWPQWLARAVRQVRTRTDCYGQARIAIERSSSFAPEPAQCLGGAVLALAAGKWNAAQAELQDWNTASSDRTTSLEAFVACAARVEVIEHLGRPGLIGALDRLMAASAALHAEGATADLDLFTMPTGRQDVFERYRTALDSHDAMERGVQFIQSQLESYPDDGGLRRLRAEFLIDQGRLSEGIRELRSIAKAHERAGDLPAMAETMRSISQAVPDNLEIKEMLVDVYLSRGILDEALRELEALALLKHEDDDIPGTIDAYTRAAGIACTLGNIALGNDLYGRGVEVDPDNVPVRHAAVAFYLQTGAVSRATEHLREIVRIAMAEKELDEAVAALQQVIGLDPHDIDSYHKLGEVLTTMSEYKQAERVYHRLAGIVPYDPVLQAKQTALAVLAETG